MNHNGLCVSFVKITTHIMTSFRCMSHVITHNKYNLSLKTSHLEAKLTFASVVVMLGASAAKLFLTAHD